ncbi:MAG: NUDIX hydrolase [Armatimonadota bacterium]|nr:NUDIX hydrolase [Armatimonadota bacterium]
MSNTPETYDPSQFERPSVTTDIVIFTVRTRQLNVLLIERKEWPFEGHWALPGGFVRPDETLDEAARRELREETGVANVYLQQLAAFGNPGRDPRTRVITIAYTALIPSDPVTLHADTDAADAQWFPLDALPRPLAFDHEQILQSALSALRERLDTRSQIVRGLLPARFTLTQIQEIYETLLGTPLDKRNFRKWVAAMNLVTPTGEELRGPHRPALLYEFAPAAGGAGTGSLRGLDQPAFPTA